MLIVKISKNTFNQLNHFRQVLQLFQAMNEVPHAAYLLFTRHKMHFQLGFKNSEIGVCVDAIACINEPLMQSRVSARDETGR